MHRHHVQQVCPFFATKFSLHERSRDSPFNTTGTVIAGELEGSWRAGGQQEGLQYNGEAAWQKGISDIFCKCCIGGCEETQACSSKRF